MFLKSLDKKYKINILTVVLRQYNINNGKKEE